MHNISFMTDEIFTGILSQYKGINNEYVLSRTKIDEKESGIATQQSDEQLDNTDMPDLEIEEYTAQRRNEQRQGLKILTTHQILSRLPISLAQLKAGNNSEKLKNEIDNYYTLCTDQKNLQNNSIKVCLTLVKDGSNFYEQRKQ